MSLVDAEKALPTQAELSTAHTETRLFERRNAGEIFVVCGERGKHAWQLQP